MPTTESIKAALGAFSSKFRSEAQAIDEIDRDNPAIITAIKYTGGDLVQEPVMLDGGKYIALDKHGVPVYKTTLKITAPSAKDGIDAAKAVEMETIKSHAQTQNYHVIAGLILGSWGAFWLWMMIYTICQVVG